MYTTNITTDSGTLGHGFSMAMKYQVTDRHMRMEFVQVSGVSGAVSAEGMSYVIDGQDSTMTMLMPMQHMAMVNNLSMLSNPASGTRAMMPKIEQHLTTNTVDDLGAGERILGHATHRYRFTTAGTTDITIAGETCTQPVDAVSEVWMATDVDLTSAMQSILRHFEAGPTPGLGASVQTPAVPANYPKGTPLRTVNKTMARGPNGAMTPVKSTIEYVELSKAPIADAAFAVPSDYQVTDVRKAMAQIPAGFVDSVMTQNTASSRESIMKVFCPSKR